MIWRYEPARTCWLPTARPEPYTICRQYQVADALEAGDLQIVLDRFEPRPAPVSLVHAERGQMPVKMRCFMDYAVPRLRRVLLDFGEAGNQAERAL